MIIVVGLYMIYMIINILNCVDDICISILNEIIYLNFMYMYFDFYVV